MIDEILAAGLGEQVSQQLRLGAGQLLVVRQDSLVRGRSLGRNKFRPLKYEKGKHSVLRSRSRLF